MEISKVILEVHLEPLRVSVRLLASIFLLRLLVAVGPPFLEGPVETREVLSRVGESSPGVTSRLAVSSGTGVRQGALEVLVSRLGP